jgi:hypothetical protein
MAASQLEKRSAAKPQAFSDQLLESRGTIDQLAKPA